MSERQATVNRSAPPGGVVPVLVYDDAGAAADWLSATFGLAERFRQTDDAGQVVAACLVADEGSLMVTPSRVARRPGSSGEETLRQPRSREISHKVSVRVRDLDGHHSRVVAAGATVLVPPTTYPFGERQYTAEDLAGHRWTFTESVADVAPDEWGAQIGPGYQ